VSAKLNRERLTRRLTLAVVVARQQATVRPRAIAPVYGTISQSELGQEDHWKTDQLRVSIPDQPNGEIIEVSNPGVTDFAGVQQD
jgi:hypothetical protein